MSLLNAGARTLAVGAMLLAAVTASGQDYPNKPVRIIVSAPGGGSDFMARQISQGISGPLGQPVIVENRGGTYVAEEVVSKALPDGYTLLIDASGVWIEPLLHKAPYDALKDFSPISLVSRTPLLLVVNPALPVTSVGDLIAHAKSRPGSVNYAMQSVGGANHLAGELFKAMAGVNIVGVPYKSTPQALGDLITGQVHLMFANSIASMPHVKSGRLKALAVTSAQPSTAVPGVPTVAASGLPGYEIAAVFSTFAPARTPAPIVSRLHQEIVRTVNAADTKERFAVTGSDVVTSSPQELAATVKADVAKWGKLIRETGMRAE